MLMSEGERKRGKLSLEERAFITENCSIMTVEQIADELNRTIEPIVRFIKENNLLKTEVDAAIAEDVMLRKMLRKRSYWDSLTRQLNPSELAYFEEQWVTYMKQLKGDVLPTEEMQLKQYIIMDILMGHCLEKRKQLQESIDELTINIKLEKQKADGTRDEAQIVIWETMLSQAITAAGAFYRDYTSLSDEVKKINKELKGTREQRVKQIQDSKVNWSSLAKRWDEATFREEMGQEAELHRLASEAARNRLTEYHTFGDGMVDRPMLIPEVIEKEQKDE